MMSRVDIEAMVGFISVLIPSQSFCGRVDMVGLLIKMAIINSSNEIRKAKRPEEIISSLPLVCMLAPRHVAGLLNFSQSAIPAENALTADLQ